MVITLLTIPGLWSSGPDHWQTYWERERKHTRRVEQENWETPKRADWIERIRAAVRNAPGPVVLAAHSLGCAAVAHLARQATPSELARIKGALLVAPSDVESPKYPPGTDGFVPMPLERLPFKAAVVISSDDEWVTPERARQFASAWGARIVEVGAKGHLNSASKLGSWPEGQALLRDLGLDS
ncbi:MAG: alpha/beta hydrolase [Deltaproteobacteria bacterium]|nr:MAG: alpha/beta hydrolase [Deltaproteobacteria bacterium]